MTPKAEYVPQGWEVVPLAHVIVPSAEKAEPSAFKEAHYLGLEHIESRTNRILGTGDGSAVKSTKAVFRSGDVLYGKLRPYLSKVCSPEFDGVCSTDILVFPQDPALDHRFLLHFLSQPATADYATQNASGINLPRVSAKALGEIRFPLAPLAEQRRIVSKIDDLQARSRKARECLAEIGPLLSQFRQSLLSAAFRGDLTADWRAANPNTEPATELLARIRQDRRRKWEEAELAKYEAKGKKPPRGWKERYGELNKKAVRATVADFRADTLAINEVPENWELIRLGEIACLQAGYAFKSEWFSKTGVRLLRGTNIEPGSTRWTDTVYLPVKECHRYAGYLLNEGDVVLAMDRPVIAAGIKVARIKAADLPALLLQRVGRFQIQDCISPDFIYLFVISPLFMQHIGVQATGTQLPHISTNDVESAYLPLPPLEEQQEIIRIVSKSLDAMAQIASGLCESNSALDKLDQSILAKAFRGELVPQDSNDEPAATLLERIRDSRARPLVKVKTKGKIIRVTKRNSAMTKSRFDADVKGKAYLAKLISSKGKIALTAEELLQISQLPLLDFYKQLDFEVTQKMLLEREGRLESANAT